MSSAVLVEVEHVHKTYDPSPVWMRALLRTAVTSPVVALDDLSFQVSRGEICAVVGPNGAGKSTLFRVLTGLTTPTKGRATVLGLDVTRESTEVRRVVGFVPADDRSLFLRLTARENLVFHAQLQGVPRREVAARVDDALELVDLTAKRDRVGFALSAGMRARLQLARALVHQPEVLILDEPTGSVDPVGSYQLLRAIEQVTAERGLAVLLSSHRLEEIEALRDHVLLLDHGHLVYEGELRSLRRLWEVPRLHVRFVNDEAAEIAAKLLRQHDDVEVDLSPPEIVVNTPLGTGHLLSLLSGQLADIASIHESVMPLLEVLAKVAEQRPRSPPGGAAGEHHAAPAPAPAPGPAAGPPAARPRRSRCLRPSNGRSRSLLRSSGSATGSRRATPWPSCSPRSSRSSRC